MIGSAARASRIAVRRFDAEGGRGRAFGAALDLGEGLVQQELRVAGNACNYAAVGGLAPTGEWTAEPLSEAPFTTRMLVTRPARPTDFSGTVIVEWANVSSG